MICDANEGMEEKNLWGANQDELIATNDQFTLCDHLGSVRDVINAEGKLLNHIEYNAFGKVVKMTGQSDCAFGYTGKIFDNQTKLQWNINRWYDAEVGRRISEDPIGFEGKDVNLSRYVCNITTMLLDALGFWWKLCHKGGSADSAPNSTLHIETDASIYNTTARVETEASASYWTLLYGTYTANSSRGVWVECNITTGEISPDNCTSHDALTNHYVATRSDISCSRDTCGRKLTVHVGSAASYSKSPGSIGLTVTVVGTGGGFTYS